MKNIIKYIWSFAVFVIAISLFTSCSKDAVYNTTGVVIDIETPRVATNLVLTSFSTNKPAYYCKGIIKADEAGLLLNRPTNFMNSYLDSLYMDYLVWRQPFMVSGESNVAPFSSHCLDYGNTEYTFSGTDESTDYYIFAFVVDPVTNSPAGELFYKQITTLDKDEDKLHVDFRIDGSWIFAYPKDQNDKINDFVSYAWDYIDSVVFVNEYVLPEIYVLNSFTDDPGIEAFDNTPTVGITAYNDEPNEYLKEGNTYYLVYCIYDYGEIDIEYYKFKYQGSSTSIELHYDKDRIIGIDTPSSASD